MKDELIQALEEQVSCYRRLAKLAELQHVHVQQEQTDALMDVLTSRSTIVEEIAQLERVIGPAKRDWLQYVTRAGADCQARAELLLEETFRLLEQINRSDQNDVLVLQQRKLNLGRQINQASAARQVNRNYAIAAYGSRPARMDVQR